MPIVRTFALSLCRAIERYYEAPPIAAEPMPPMINVNDWEWRKAVLVWCLWADPKRLRKTYPKYGACFVPTLVVIEDGRGGIIDWRYHTAIVNLLAECGAVIKQGERSRGIWRAPDWNVYTVRWHVRMVPGWLPCPTEPPPSGFFARGQLTDGTGTDLSGQWGQPPPLRALAV